MDDMSKDWMAVHVMWTEYSVVAVAFVINRFILMPRQFFAKRYVWYALSITLLLLLLSLFVIYFDGVNLILSLFKEGGFEPMMPPHGAPPFGAPPMMAPPSTHFIPPAITVVILSVIVLALDMGLSIAVKWIISEQRQAEINREHITAQLANLQSQVSPHFFMNTLNNIHALVDIAPSHAKQTIIELSGLMSYLLYDSSTLDKVLLHKEIEFINNYVNLMRLRFAKQVSIEFSHDEEIPEIKIPPLLFLNFVENAFKYGVDYEQDSFIKIRFSFSSKFVEMNVINTNHSTATKSERHGLGIENSYKRLDLLYGDSYTLDICDKEEIYNVNLKIPIQ